MAWPINPADGTSYTDTDGMEYIYYLSENKWMRQIPLASTPVNTAPSIDIMALSTLTKTFTEDFKTQNIIDRANTTAATLAGSVRTSFLPAFTENFINTNYSDLVDSTAVTVDTANQRVIMNLNNGVTSGTFYSSSIPTGTITSAKINANATTPAFLSAQGTNNIFFNKTYIGSNTVGTSNSYFQTITDRTGRLWKTWATSGYFNFQCYNGTTLAFQNYYSGLTIASGINQGYAPALVFDGNNRLWVFYTTGVSSSVNINFFVLNPDGTVYRPFAILQASGSNYGQEAISAAMDSNGRLWVMWVNDSFSTGSGGSTYYTILNSDGSVYKTPTVITSTAANATGYMNTQILYDSVKGYMVLLAPTSIGYYNMYQLNLSGAIVTTLNQAFIASSAFAYMEYDSVNQQYVCIYISGSNFTIKRFSSTGLTTVSTKTVTGISVLTSYTFSIFNDNGIYRAGLIATGQNNVGGTSPETWYISFQSDGTIVDAAVQGTNNASPSSPYIFRDTDGNVKVFFTNSTGGIYSLAFSQQNTTAVFSLSNDGGLTWIPATLGQLVTFSQSGTAIRVRIDFAIPFGSTSPSAPFVNQYSLILNGTHNGDLTEVFQSATLPALSPISTATLTADCQPNDGIITWYVSNDGGTTWTPVALGQVLNFINKLNGDLRVKAVLFLPQAGVNTPIITSYTIISTNLSTMTDISSLQDSLIKTNFKVSTLQNASKYGLKNMVIDDYNDATGINVSSSSNYSFDSTNKLIKVILGTAIPAMTSNTAPSGVASSSGIYSSSYDAWQAFNQAQTSVSAWITPNGTMTGWLQYKFTSATVITKYAITTRNMGSGDPGTWTFQGSNDGSTWTTLDTQTSVPTWGSQETRTYLLSNTTAYLYYRINVSAANTNRSSNPYLAIGQLQMISSNTNAIIVSTVDTAATAPTRVLLDAEYTTPIPATDTIKFEISRDGGTTWTMVTPGIVQDISGTPTGTSIVSRVTLVNNATITSLGYSWQ